MMNKNKTLEYYNKNADFFAKTTINVDFYETQNRFSTLLSEHRYILDLKQNLYRQKEEYNELFGLNVISRQEGNVIMSEGLVLQDAGIWKESMQIQTIPYNNMTELYFEDNDIEGIVKKLESGRYEVRYATALTELDGGQKLVRFYDPSGNLIEVRTPWDKFVNRE